MNIIIINHYAGNLYLGMEYRPFLLAKEWIRMGHNVIIIGASYSHVRYKQPEIKLSKISLYNVEIVDSVKYEWFFTPLYSGNGIFRFINIITFLFGVWKHSNRISNQYKPDIVIASSTYPMDYLIARKIARSNAAKVGFEIHDLWPLSLIQISGMKTSHPFVLLCEYCSNIAFKNSDFLISLLPNISLFLKKKNIQYKKLIISPNGIDLENWSDINVSIPDDIQQCIDSCRDKNKIIVGYTGSHGKPNALHYLIEAAHLLREEPLSIIMIGDGSEKQLLCKMIEDLRLTNVKMFASIPKSQIHQFLKQIDIAYIGWEDLELYQYGISPNKLIDYMMAACPVLHSIGITNDDVTISGCGINVQPADPRSIANGLITLSKLTTEQRRSMGQLGRDFIINKKSYKVIAKRYLEEIQID